MSWLYNSNVSNKWVQSYVQGFMDISGPRLQVRNGNLIVSDSDYAVDVSTTSNIFVTGTSYLNHLDVSGHSTMHGDVCMNNVTITNHMGIGTPYSSDKTLTVSGNILALNNLEVSGQLIINVLKITTLELSGNFQVDDNLTVVKNGYFKQDVDISGHLGIGKPHSSIYTLDVSGSANMNSNLYVNSQIGVGTTNPAANAAVDISGSSNGLRNLILRTGASSMTPNTIAVKTYDSSSAVFMTTSVSGGTYHYLTRPGDSYIGFNDSNRSMGLVIGPNNSTSMNGGIRIDASGNVGIGTNNPKFPLDVSGAINFSQLNTSSVSVGSSSILNFTTYDGGSNPYSKLLQPGDGLIDFTDSAGGGSDVLMGLVIAPKNPTLNGGIRMDASGKVGIGTSPASNTLLDISGSSNGTNNLVLRTGIKSATPNYVSVKTYDSSSVVLLTTSVSGQSYSKLIQPGDSLFAFGDSAFGADVSMGLVIAPINSAGGIRMDASGRVGINNTNPQAQLDISGQADGTNNLVLRTGIKSATPNYVSVKTFDNSSVLLMTTSVSGQSYSKLIQSGDSLIAFGADVSMGLVIAPINSAGGIRIDASGRVGINNTNPQAQLDISGQADGTNNLVLRTGIKSATPNYVSVKTFDNSSVLLMTTSVSGQYSKLIQPGDSFIGFGNSAGGLVISPINQSSSIGGIRIDASGRVGINNTNPQAPLDISGCMVINSTANIQLLSPSGGTVTISHSQPGGKPGVSSIVFPSNIGANDYGSIIYVDDVTQYSSTGFPNYYGVSGTITNNSNALILMAQNDPSGVSGPDDVIVLAAGNIVLDPGNSNGTTGSTGLVSNGNVYVTTGLSIGKPSVNMADNCILDVNGTTNMTSIANYNFNSIKTTSGTINKCAISYGGLYQMVVDSSGYVYESSNNGVSWSTINSGLPTGQNWISCAMSYGTSINDGGQYQIIGAKNGSGSVYTSTNYGISWSQVSLLPIGSIYNWQSCAISNGGTYMMAVNGTPILYTSNNSGNSWTSRNYNSGSFIFCAMTTDGQYQIALNSNGNIYISIDSGANFSINLYQTVANATSCAFSSTSSGPSVIITTSTGYFYKSIYNIINPFSSWSNTQITTLPLTSCSISADGKYIIVVSNGGNVYQSTDSGISWSPYIPASVANWTSCAISYNGTNQLICASNTVSLITLLNNNLALYVNGNIGIGTMNPAGLLDISSVSNGNMILRTGTNSIAPNTISVQTFDSANSLFLTTSVNGSNPYNKLIQQGDSLIGFGDSFGGTNGSMGLVIAPKNSSSINTGIRIDASGKLGIGTTAASSALLDISGQADGAHNFVLRTGVKSATPNLISAQSYDGNASVWMTTSVSGGLLYNKLIQQGDSLIGFGDSIGANGTNGSMGLVIAPKNPSSINTGIRMDASGKLGIGTTAAPSALLDISGQADGAHNLVLRTGVKSATPNIISAQTYDGNASVSMTTSVSGGGLLYSKLIQPGDSLIGFGDSLGTNGTNGSMGLVIAPNNSNSGVVGIRMDASGRVGIGTSNPQYELDINGTVHFTNIATGNVLVQSGANAPTLFMATSAIDSTYSKLYKPGDALISFTDAGYKEGTDSSMGLVIAPKNASTSVAGMRIDSSGNVGIGTIAASNAILDISGQADGAHSLILRTGKISNTPNSISIQTYDSSSGLILATSVSGTNPYNSLVQSGDSVISFYDSAIDVSMGLVIAPKNIGSGMRMDACGNIAIGKNNGVLYLATTLSGGLISNKIAKSGDSLISYSDNGYGTNGLIGLTLAPNGSSLVNGMRMDASGRIQMYGMRDISATTTTNVITFFTPAPGVPTTGTTADVAISGNGQYQLSINGTALYESSNNGLTWAQVTGLPANGLASCAASNTGQYQVVTGTGNYIYVSNNYGQTWTPSSVTAGANLSCVSISSSGQKQIVVDKTRGFWYSTNYGSSWTINNALSNSSSNWLSGAISADGNYGLVLNGSDSNHSNVAVIYIINPISSNTVTIRSLDISYNYGGCAISSNGQRQIIVLDNSYIQQSTDYGQTWSPFISAGALHWNSCAMSANGQYMMATASGGYIYQTVDYGATWGPMTNNNTGNPQTSAMDANGLYQLVGSSGVYTSSSIPVTTYAYTSNTSALNINGSLGIGVPQTNALLDISGDSTSTNNMILRTGKNSLTPNFISAQSYDSSSILFMTTSVNTFNSTYFKHSNLVQTGDSLIAYGDSGNNTNQSMGLVIAPTNSTLTGAGIRMDQSGNVGIGNIAGTGYSLDVCGNMRVSGSIIGDSVKYNSGSFNTIGTIQLDASSININGQPDGSHNLILRTGKNSLTPNTISVQTYDSSSNLILTTSVSGGIYSSLVKTGDSIISFGDSGIAGSSTDVSMGLVIAPRNTNAGIGGIRIDSYGGVGIGTTAATNALLDISGAADATNNMILRTGNSSSMPNYISVQTYDSSSRLILTTSVNTSTSSFNHSKLVQTGDSLIAYGDSSNNTNQSMGLVIAPTNSVLTGAGIRLDQSGNVGIGKSPGASYSLDVSGNVNITGSINTGSVSNNSITTGSLYTVSGLSSFTGISMNNSTTVNNTTAFQIYMDGTNTAVFNNKSNGTGYYFYTSSSANLVFGIGNNGNTQVSNSSSNGGMTVYGSIIVYNGNLTVSSGSITAGNGLTVSSGGLTVTSGGLTVSSGNISVNSGSVSATSFNATSDYRVKENVVPLDSQYTIDVLRPVHYYNTLSKREDIGFIAHEVEEYYPFMVTGEKDGSGNQTLNYSAIIPILVKEVRDFKQETQSLKDELKGLKSTVQSQYQKMEQMAREMQEMKRMISHLSNR